MNRSSLLSIGLLLTVVTINCRASVSGKDSYLTFSGFSDREIKTAATVMAPSEGYLQQVVENIAPASWNVSISPSLDGFSRNQFSWSGGEPCPTAFINPSTENNTLSIQKSCVLPASGNPAGAY